MYNILDSIIISLLHFQKYVLLKTKVYLQVFEPCHQYLKKVNIKTVSVPLHMASTAAIN